MTDRAPERIECDPYVIRKHGAFYRSDRAGYTNHIEAAGIYTKEEAEAEARVEPENIFAVRLKHYEPELRRNRDLAQKQIDLIAPSPPALSGEAELQVRLDSACRDDFNGETWKFVRSLFGRYGMDEPPSPLRDELVSWRVAYKERPVYRDELSKAASLIERQAREIAGLKRAMRAMHEDENDRAPGGGPP